MKFLSLIKKISKNVEYYDKFYAVPYSKGNMTNPFRQTKKFSTMIWIDK